MLERGAAPGNGCAIPIKLMWLVIFNGDCMNGSHGSVANTDLLVELFTGDIDAILDGSCRRLLTVIWGSGSEPTRLPRSALAGWFNARDALTSPVCTTASWESWSGATRPSACCPILSTGMGNRAPTRPWTGGPSRLRRPLPGSPGPSTQEAYADAW